MEHNFTGQNAGNTLDVSKAKHACVESFATYCRIMQDDGYFDPVHEKICYWTQGQILKLLDEVQKKGTCNGKLAYIMPRGSLKSTIITKHLSTWLTLFFRHKLKDDSLRTLIAGNTYTNSKKKLNGIRGMFDSHEIFQAIFDEDRPRKQDKWSDESACLPRKRAFDESTFEVGSLNTKLTGRHYNVIIEDDTTAPDADEMSQDLTRPSSENIQKAIGFHQAAMPLFVPKGFRLSIVVSTRWAMEDLINFVLKKEGYAYIDIPAEVNGTPLFTNFYDEETLEVIRKRVGEYMYSCLYLNKPIDDSLRVFRSTDFQYILPSEVPEGGYFSVAIDPAISEKDDSCETAITACYHYEKAGKHYEYWFEDKHAHLNPFAQAEELLKMAMKYDKIAPVKCLVIETIAYQDALRYIVLNLMKEERFKRFNIVKAKRGNKKVRIEGMQPSFQAKRVFFVSGNLTDQTESQLLQYPNGVLVDIIDCWSMHRKVWRSDKLGAPEIEPEEDVNSFERVYEEHTKRKYQERMRQNIGLTETSSGEVWWTGLQETAGAWLR